MADLYARASGHREARGVVGTDEVQAQVEDWQYAFRTVMHQGGRVDLVASRKDGTHALHIGEWDPGSGTLHAVFEPIDPLPPILVKNRGLPKKGR